MGWALIWFADNVYYLYLARLLNGIVAGGIFAIIPQFLAEVSSDQWVKSLIRFRAHWKKYIFIHIFNRVSLIIDSVRGVLGSTLVLSCNMGILLSFIFGHFFQFYVTPIIAIAFTVVFVVSLFFFPESPLVLMKQNKLSVC